MSNSVKETQPSESADVGATSAQMLTLPVVFGKLHKPSKSRFSPFVKK